MVGLIYCRKCGCLIDRKRKLCDGCVSPGTLASMKTNRGRSYSDEHKQHIAEAQKGNKYAVGSKLSPENKEKLRQANIGRKLSDSQKQAISKVHKGKKLSQQHIQRLREVNTGNTYTKGIKLSEDAKLRLASTRITKHSPETKAKLAELAKGRKHTPETKRKLAQMLIDGKTGYKGQAKRPKHIDSYGKSVTFRSTFEYAVAKYLDSMNVNWRYEAQVLVDGDYVYIPDFFIYDKYGELIRIIEVKGWYPQKAVDKVTRFKELLESRNIILEVWTQTELRELKLL